MRPCAQPHQGAKSTSQVQRSSMAAGRLIELHHQSTHADMTASAAVPLAGALRLCNIACRGHSGKLLSVGGAAKPAVRVRAAETAAQPLHYPAMQAVNALPRTFSRRNLKVPAVPLTAAPRARWRPRRLMD